MKPILRVSDLTYSDSQGQWLSLNHLSFSVYPSEFVSIVSPAINDNPLFSLIKSINPPIEGSISFPSTDFPLHLGHLSLKEETLTWDSSFTPTLSDSKQAPLNTLVRHYQTNCISSPHTACPSYCAKLQQLILTLATFPDLLLLEFTDELTPSFSDFSFLDELYELKQSHKLSVLMLTASPREALLLSDIIYLFNPITGNITQSLMPFAHCSKLLPSQKINTQSFLQHEKQLNHIF
ncbi:MAG: hypothetical protein ACI4C1_04725 [Lachnospiraceae bacterium]